MNTGKWSSIYFAEELWGREVWINTKSDRFEATTVPLYLRERIPVAYLVYKNAFSTVLHFHRSIVCKTECAVSSWTLTGLHTRAWQFQYSSICIALLIFLDHSVLLSKLSAEVSSSTSKHQHNYQQASTQLPASINTITSKHQHNYQQASTQLPASINPIP